MRNTNNSLIPHDIKTILIKVYSYENQNLYGTLKNSILGKVKHFENLTQMLSQVEQLLKASESNEAFSNHKLRLRSAMQRIEPDELISRSDGKAGTVRKEPIATFEVKVIFQQSATWQGAIIWSDRNIEQHYRSVLEMITLMNGALMAA